MSSSSLFDTVAVSTFSLLNGTAVAVGTLTPEATATLTKLAHVLGVMLGFSVGVTLLTLLVYTVTALSTSRRANNGSYDAREVIARVAHFGAALWLPIATLAGLWLQYLANIGSLLIANVRLIIGALLVALLANLLVTHYDVLFAAWGALQIGLMFVIRTVVLYLVDVLELLFDVLYVWINLLVIRIPSDFVRGFFFDAAACGDETWRELARTTALFVLESTHAITAWSESGRAVLTVAPDFGAAALLLGRMIGTLNTFGTCVCASGTSLTAPFVLAFDEGAPAPYSVVGTDELTPFATAINATAGAPFVAAAFFARPIFLIREGINANQSASVVLGNSQISFNATLNTWERMLNGTFGVGTNIVQQYWVAIGRATTMGVYAGIDFLAPPPVLFECYTGFLMAPLYLSNMVVNAIIRFESTFTTYNGQAHLSAAEMREAYFSSIACACRIITWFADSLRFIARDIQASCTSSDECTSLSPCVPAANYGRCASTNVSDVLLCTSDAECAVSTVVVACVDFVCTNAQSNASIACTADFDCQVCVFDSGTCASGDACVAYGDASECATPPAGACVNSVCHARDAYNNSLPLYEAPCETDADCDACYASPAQCTGVCDGISFGDEAGMDIGGCILSIIAGAFDLACCVYVTLKRIAYEWPTLLWRAVIGFIYTIVSRIDDATNTRCTTGFGALPENAWFCSVPRNILGIFDFFAYQAGHRRPDGDAATDVCPPQLCILEQCTSDADCTQLGTLGFANELYGAAPVCDLRWNRCVHTPGSCSALGIPLPTTPVSACVDGTTNLCILADCRGKTCPDGPLTNIFACNCTCPYDEYREFISIGLDFGVCIGDSAVLTYGSGGSALRCLFINITSLLVELLDFVVDIVSQLGIILDTPSETRGTAFGMVRAVRGIGNCLGRIWIDITTATAGGASLTSVQSDMAKVALGELGAKLLACIIDLLTNSFAAFEEGAKDIFQWFFEDIVPSFFQDVTLFILKTFLILVSLVFYILAAFFYVIGSFSSALFSLAELFEDIGDIIKNSADDIIMAILDIILFLGDCIAGLIEFIFMRVPACLGGLALMVPDDTPCQNMFDPLLPCITKLWTFITQALAAIVSELLCFVRSVSCFFGITNDIATCPDVTVDECNDSFLPCLVEEFSCNVLRIPLDLMCTTNAVCPYRDIFCIFYDIICSIEVALLGLLTFVQNTINFIFAPIINVINSGLAAVTCILDGDPFDPCIIPPNNNMLVDLTTGIWPLFIDSTFIPQASCCIPNNVPFVASSCFNPGFAIFAFASPTNHTCTVTRKLACWQHLSDNDTIQLAGAGRCCNSLLSPGSPCSAKRKRQDGEYIDAHAYLNKSYAERLAEAQLAYEESGAAVVMSQLTPEAALALASISLSAPSTPELLATAFSTADVLASFDTYTSTYTDVFTSTCVERVRAALDDDTVAWPPMSQLVDTAPTSVARFMTATCMSYLHAQTTSLRMQRLLTARLLAAPEPDTNSLAYKLAEMASAPSTTAFKWMFSYVTELSMNTAQLLVADANAAETAPISRPTTLAVIGGPYLQFEPAHCRPGVLPAAILADWLTPTLGTAARTFFAGLRAGAAAVLAVRAGGEPSREMAALHTLANVTSLVTARLAAGNFRDGVAELVTLTAGGSVATLKRSAEMLVTLGHEAPSAALVMAHALTRPRTPEMALRRHLAARDKRSAREVALTPLHRRRKRQSDPTLGVLSTWVAETRAQLDASATLMMRRALYGTDDMARIAAQLATTTTCDTSASPFTCCPDQLVCTNCSVFDRIAWDAQDGVASIVAYYSNEFEDRYLPCIAERIESGNYMGVAPSRLCPALLCTAAECTSDAECVHFDTSALALNRTRQARVCHAGLRRCAVAQCDNTTTDRTCYNDNTGDLGVCVAGNVCNVTTNTLAVLGCQCPDTFLTANPRVPPLLSRLTTLRVPCLLNSTCFFDSILGENASATVPYATCSDGSLCDRFAATPQCVDRGSCVAGACVGSTTVMPCTTNASCDVCFAHQYAGTWLSRKTQGSNSNASNLDVTIVTALDAGFSGLGTRIVTWIEDTIFFVSLVGSNGDVYERVLATYFYCDPKRGLFCPLDAPADASCCSDRCEQRTYGTSLFDGIVFAILTVLVPVILFSLCPCGIGSCCVAWWPRLIFFLFWPVAFMYAFGGGILCYVPGALWFIIGAIPVLIALAQCMVRCCLFLPTCIRSSLPSISLPCAPCSCSCVDVTLPDCSVVVNFLNTALLVIGMLFMYAAYLPGLPTCFGLHAFTFLSEIAPPCYQPPFPALINRTLLDPLEPCVGRIPALNLCSVPGALGDSRMNDGIDVLLYAAQHFDATFNEQLLNLTASQPRLAFLAPYAAAHTTAAHATAGPLLDACFWVSTPHIVSAAILLFFTIAVSYAVASIIIRVLPLVVYVLFLGGYAVFTMIDQISRGWVYRLDEQGATTYATTSDDKDKIP